MVQHLVHSSLYRYEPLADRHVRLLKLLYTPNDDQAYELIETCLEAAPPYEAASYVWGEQNKCRLFTLHPGRTVLITPTLSDTLTQFRRHCQTGYLWVDQICIDQSSMAEYNQQVALMGDIYRSAQRVLIWLGPEDADSQHILRLFDSISTIHEQHEMDYRSSANLYSPSKQGAPRANQYTAVRALLQLPWFSRAWVVQEAVLPAIATCFLGPLYLDIDALWDLVTATRNAQETASPIDSTDTSIRQLPGYLVFSEIMRLRKQQRCGPTTRHDSKAFFYHSLSIFAPRCRASKRHDMIFAFLGLLDDPRVHISPDYKMNADQIPALATRSIIEGTGSFDLFGVLHRQRDEGNRWPALPSWVPDWSRRLGAEPMVFPESRTYFNASSGFQHKKIASTESNWSRLVVAGKIIGEVAFRVPFTGGSEPPTSNRNGWDIRSYLEIPQVHEALKRQWPEDLATPTQERVMAAVLADGSFTFDGKERHRCRNGISESHLKSLLQMYRRLHIPVLEDNAEWKKRAILRDHARIAWGRVLVVDRDWKLGLAHAAVQEGDLVCILHGSKVPMILRRLHDGYYRLMGQCYLEGVMRGETHTWQEEDADSFVLV